MKESVSTTCLDNGNEFDVVFELEDEVLIVRSGLNGDVFFEADWSGNMAIAFKRMLEIWPVEDEIE